VFNHSAHERTVALPWTASAPSCLLTTGPAPGLSHTGSAVHIILAPYSAVVLGDDAEPDARQNR
jgi:hypothetical protein